VHNVSQWPNLRHLVECLGGADGLLEAVSFQKATISQLVDISVYIKWKTVMSEAVNNKRLNKSIMFHRVTIVWTDHRNKLYYVSCLSVCLSVCLVLHLSVCHLVLCGLITWVWF